MAIPDSERAPTAAPPPRDASGALLCSYCRQPAVLRETSTHLFDRDRDENRLPVAVKNPVTGRTETSKQP